MSMLRLYQASTSRSKPRQSFIFTAAATTVTSEPLPCTTQKDWTEPRLIESTAVGRFSMRNDIPTISPTTDSALISIISHLISPPCGSHALAMPDTQIEQEENEVVFFLLSFSDLSHHRTCGSAYGGSLSYVQFDIAVHQTRIAGDTFVRLATDPP